MTPAETITREPAKEFTLNASKTFASRYSSLLSIVLAAILGRPEKAGGRSGSGSSSGLQETMRTHGRPAVSTAPVVPTASPDTSSFAVATYVPGRASGKLAA